MKKKTCILLTILAYFIFLGIFVYKYLSFTPQRIEVPYEDFVRTTIPDDRNGWYIDSSFPCLDDGLFVYTEDLSLKPGVYRVTVKYDATTDTSFSTVSAKTNALFGLYADEVPLKSFLHEVSYDVYLFDKTDNLRVEFYYGKNGELIAKDVSIESTKGLIKIQFCVTLFLLVVATYLIYEKKTERKKRLLILTICTVFTSLPVFIGAIRYGVDIGFHLTRIEGLKHELLMGNIPVKMQSIWQYGYGYPVSAYYGDLFLVIPAAMRIMGFSVQFSYNTFLFIINFATIAITYWCVKKMTNHEILSYTSAMIYTLSPYRLSDIYYGSTIGETLAMTFFPLIAYSMYVIFTENAKEKSYKRLWIPLVLGLSGVVQSHMLSCLLLAYVIIIVCLTQIKKVFEKERFLVLLKSAVYTIVLNLWFIYPCITSMNNFDIRKPYRNIGGIQDSGATLGELFTFWGKGSECIKGIGFALGVAFVVFLIIYVSDKNKLSKRTKYLFALEICVLFAASIYFPWNKISAMLGKHAVMVNNIQFPSRLLGIGGAISILAFACLIIDLKLEERDRTILILALLTVTVISGEYNIYTGNKLDDIRSVYDTAKLGRTDYCMGEYVYYPEENETIEEYLGSKVALNSLLPDKVTTTPNVGYNNYYKLDSHVEFDICNINSEEGYIEVPLLYYEQYVAKNERGERLETVCGDNHVLRVVVPDSFSGRVFIDYTEPVIWKVTYIVSFLAWLAFALLLLQNWRLGRRKGQE